MQMLKKWMLILAVLLVMPGVEAIANTDVAPDVVLQEHARRVMAELSRDGGAIKDDMNRLYQLVEREILPLVDFKSMSKLILGKHWRKASKEQRKAFIAAFRNLLVNTYTKSLKQYANQNIKFFPHRTRVKGKYATVYSEFVPGNGQRNVPVIYKLRKDKHGEWKAYNLEIEGLSVVKNFRTDFNSEINAKGLDALIARLEREQAERRKEAEAN